MEMSEDGFLEELLSLRRDTWETSVNPSSDIDGFFSTSSWGFDGLDSSSAAASTTLLPNSTSYDSLLSSSIDQQPSILDCSSFVVDNLFVEDENTNPTAATGTQVSRTLLEQCPFPVCPQSEYSSMSMVVREEDGLLCKAEPPSSLSSGEVQPSNFHNMGLCMESSRSNVTTPTSGGNNKSKKIEGQPSKNLMAERRRRKRLNDRLSMLRSVVPKISKMDRTSILGDTIDYMKELLEKINNLKEQVDVGSNQFNVMSIFKDVLPNDVLVRNSPKFDIERRNLDTRVEICCSGKPGLLLSTVSTLEALGLEIQQCVISCFSDFSLQASCSEEMGQRSLLSSEDIKQALFRNAGYGGRCL